MNKQKVILQKKELFGGYDYKIAGEFPWSIPTDPDYITGKSTPKHPYTDSSASAVSMTSGIKTYNASINVTHDGKQVDTIAHILQRKGFATGVVTSVPISHATPASAYSHNVTRSDMQDLSRDLLGLPSISHPGAAADDTDKSADPLPGVDLLFGAGWGENSKREASQGSNYVPGNQYIADEDIKKVDAANGGKYTWGSEPLGRKGASVLTAATDQAIANKTRLFGFLERCKVIFRFVLPMEITIQRSTSNAEPKRRTLSARRKKYSKADLFENPILADFATNALRYLNQRSDKFWMMIEAGDVDWGNHANNIDSSIGAVISGDMAFKAIVDWVEKEKAWDDTAIIVTADHGHYLVLTRPDMLVGE